jgi:uncharacterized membrane protein HdeD (DUF308 family)
MEDNDNGIGGTPRDDDSGAGGAPLNEERVHSTPPDTTSRTQTRQLDRQASWGAHNWAWMLGLGIVALVLGIVIASHAFGSVSALTWLSGLFLLFLGIAQLMTVGRGGDRRTHLAGGLIAIVGGIVLLVWPGETVHVVAVVAGITVLAWGVLRGVSAWRDEHATRRHDLAVSVALIVLGVVMIVWPGGTITIIGLLVGVAAIAWGATMIVSAFHLRAIGRRWEARHSHPHAG